MSINNVINNATGPAAALIPSQVAACRDQALALVGDAENCHLFYRCDMLDTATPQVTHWAVEIKVKYISPNPEIPLTQIVHGPCCSRAAR